MHKLVSQTFLAIIAVLLILSVRMGNRAKKRNTGELSFSPFLYVLGGSAAVFAVFPIVMTLFVHDQGQYVAKGILVAGFGLTAMLCAASAYITRGKFDAQGIELRTLLTGHRKAQWSELESVTYNRNGWHLLKFRDGCKIRISDWLGGSIAALEMARDSSNCSFQRTRYARR
ncbi:MAG TPA: hypothetical protein VHA71_00570 [Rhodanobacteraceae bacterium]|jgi:hypothetical protein|nr:hypothetical protein [Rhodanobacteraceae bacterium]